MSYDKLGKQVRLLFERMQYPNLSQACGALKIRRSLAICISLCISGSMVLKR